MHDELFLIIMMNNGCRKSNCGCHAVAATPFARREGTVDYQAVSLFQNLWVRSFGRIQKRICREGFFGFAVFKETPNPEKDLCCCGHAMKIGPWE